jgi:gamma-glutamylcyclotransferase (GGCT)/AIG2-like uncharacterized protein YtfP
MAANIFTYGSLMFPQVWGLVVGGQYRSGQATVANFARYAIDGETYPGMIAQAGSSVQGVLYFDVEDRDVAALDRFEGDDYLRISVPVQLVGGAGATAETYLYQPAHRLNKLPWRPEAFQMQRFLQTYCRDKLDK